MKNYMHIYLVMFVYVVLSGCVSNYQYTSYGEFTTANGEKRDAVMYWHKDEGRLWYGKKYEKADSDITVLICLDMPKLFSLGSDNILSLPSKSGDLLAAELNEEGNLLLLSSAERLREGSECGFIRVENKKVNTEHLTEGVVPAVSILCKNDSRPDRYPAINNYLFKPVSRQESGKDQNAPEPCISR